MKIIPCITILLVTASCGSRNEKHEISWTDSAVRDHANGINRILIAGPELLNHEQELSDSLATVFGFYYDHITQPTPGETKGIAEYDRVMDSLLEQRNGHGWETRFVSTLDSLKRTFNIH